jgi:hypothetical protein
VPDVAGEVDRRHPAGPELSLDPVAVREGARESVDQGRLTMP